MAQFLKYLEDSGSDRIKKYLEKIIHYGYKTKKFSLDPELLDGVKGHEGCVILVVNHGDVKKVVKKLRIRNYPSLSLFHNGSKKEVWKADMDGEVDVSIKDIKKAIEDATKYAAEIPLRVMETSFNSIEVMLEMMKNGLQNSLSDGGVGVLCAKTAVTGAYFNVRINVKDINDLRFKEDILSKAEDLYQKTLVLENEMMNIINSNI